MRYGRTHRQLKEDNMEQIRVVTEDGECDETCAYFRQCAGYYARIGNCPDSTRGSRKVIRLRDARTVLEQ